MFHELSLNVKYKNIPLQKKEESNEIQRSQNKYVLFYSSENICIFVDFWENEITPKWFFKDEICSLRNDLIGLFLKNHKSKFLKRPGREVW